MKKLPITPLKKMIFIALLAAIAMMFMLCFGVAVIPGATYLKYEPSGGVILLCGFLLGPAGALQCALVKCILYMLVHGGSPYGHLSDLLATCVFVGTATFLLYRMKRPGRLHMILCALAGAIAATLVMIPANYVILHLQHGMSPSAVSASMIYIIPFNLVKTGLNSAFALCLYPPIAKAIEKSLKVRNDPHV